MQRELALAPHVAHGNKAHFLEPAEGSLHRPGAAQPPARAQRGRALRIGRLEVLTLATVGQPERAVEG